KKTRRIFSEAALRERGDEDLALVHDLPQVQALVPRIEHPADQRACEERPSLVEDWGHGFVAELLSVLFELGLPERADLGVGDAGHDKLPEFRVCQEPGQVAQGGPWELPKRQEGLPQDVFHPRSPEIGPDLPEGADEAGRDEIAAARVAPTE